LNRQPRCGFLAAAVCRNLWMRVPVLLACALVLLSYLLCKGSRLTKGAGPTDSPYEIVRLCCFMISMPNAPRNLHQGAVFNGRRKLALPRTVRQYCRALRQKIVQLNGKFFMKTDCCMAKQGTHYGPIAYHNLNCRLHF
jgi:hypothetical protein